MGIINVEYDPLDSNDQYRASDWKEVSDSFFAELSAELEPLGLYVFIADTQSDTYLWFIGPASAIHDNALNIISFKE